MPEDEECVHTWGQQQRPERIGRPACGASAKPPAAAGLLICRKKQGRTKTEGEKKDIDMEPSEHSGTFGDKRRVHRAQREGGAETRAREGGRAYQMIPRLGVARGTLHGPQEAQRWSSGVGSRIPISTRPPSNATRVPLRRKFLGRWQTFLGDQRVCR